MADKLAILAVLLVLVWPLAMAIHRPRRTTTAPLCPNCRRVPARRDGAGFLRCCEKCARRLLKAFAS